MTEYPTFYEFVNFATSQLQIMPSGLNSKPGPLDPNAYLSEYLVSGVSVRVSEDGGQTTEDRW